MLVGSGKVRARSKESGLESLHTNNALLEESEDLVEEIALSHTVFIQAVLFYLFMYVY